MRFERVNEPLAWIEARFEKGAVSPLRFGWRRREFDVVATNARWVDRESRPVRYCFSVTVRSGEICELAHVAGDALWYVTGVAVD